MSWQLKSPSNTDYSVAIILLTLVIIYFSQFEHWQPKQTPENTYFSEHQGHDLSPDILELAG